MKNPFIFGRAVAGEHFVDREEELSELTASLLSGQHIVLFSPRKMGKTSLIKRAFGELEDADALCIYIDLWQTTSTHAIAKEIVGSVVNKTYTSAEKLGRELKDLFGSLRPKIYIEMDGQIGVELGREAVGGMEEALRDALDLPERVAKRKETRIIIAFDEFQEITHLNGLQLEKIFRSTLQHHENVSYIFAGSERSLINMIFGEKERPFYRFAKQMELNPISDDVLERFITDKFIRSGKEIDRDAAAWIAEFSRGVPYYVQHICHEVWYMTERTADMGIVERCLEEQILPSLSSGFQTIWSRIRSREQRRLLICIANEDQPQIYSQKIIEKYELKSPGHVGKAVRALNRAGLMDGNGIEDIFFEEWVRATFSF
jgi:AAA+ ATPase superfamily predicted ATPase